MWGCEPPVLWKRRPYGVSFERALMGSCRTSIVTLPLFMRFRDIAAFMLHSTPLFPTPSLVSPKFPHVPLGVGGQLLGYKERRCCAISFQDFQPVWSWSTNVTDSRTDGRTDRQTDKQTDRQTDRRTTCNRKTALCAIVHRTRIMKVPKW